MTPQQQRAEFIDLYRTAAANAFGWAEVRRGKQPKKLEDGEAELSPQEAEDWFRAYMGGVPTTQRLAQRPGSPMHLIGLAFQDMGQSADEFERWGYRLTAAHDWLIREGL